MRPRRFRSSTTTSYSRVSNAVSLEETVRVVKAINKRVERDRIVASAAAREKYLRSLMGLGPVRSLIDDRHEADA